MGIASRSFALLFVVTVTGCSANSTTTVESSSLGTAPLRSTTTTSVSTTSVPPPSTTPSPTRATTTTPATTTTLVWQKYPTTDVVALSESGQPVARVARVDTTDRVVFLTIDDGIHRDPRIPQFLADHDMPASLFLVRGPMLEDPEYFRAFIASGSTINSHTLTHPDLSGASYERQRSEICGMVDLIRSTYGYSGVLFRPPYGSSDGNTRRAAASCGLAAIVTWNSELWEGNVDLARRPNLQPGDVFLTHFRTDLYDNLVAFAARVEAEGFTVASLDRYLVAPVSGE